MQQIDAWKYTRGVLVYATGDLHAKLVTDHKLTQVTVDTPAKDLRSMDKKKDGAYPTYLIGELYGIRGNDYRAAENPLGICMIICSPFSDPRTRI